MEMQMIKPFIYSYYFFFTGKPSFYRKLRIHSYYLYLKFPTRYVIHENLNLLTLRNSLCVLKRPFLCSQMYSATPWLFCNTVPN